jgi:hypothetical protein
MPVSDETPRVGRLICRDVTCVNCSVAGAFFYGLPEMPIACVELENILISFRPDAQKGFPAMMDQIEMAEKLGLFACNVKNLRLTGVKIEVQGTPHNYGRR